MHNVNNCKAWFAVLFLSSMAVQAARPAGTTAPGEDAAGPNLKDTVNFVQGQLNALGTLTYSLRSRDSITGATSETQVSASASNVGILVYKKPNVGTQCLFSYHDRETENTQLIEDRDLGVLLNDLAEVAVTPLESLDQDIHPSRKTKVSTPIFRMDLRSGDGGDNFLFFPSEDMADDVAKAIIHVVELCAQGEKR